METKLIDPTRRSPGPTGRPRVLSRRALLLGAGALLALGGTAAAASACTMTPVPTTSDTAKPMASATMAGPLLPPAPVGTGGLASAFPEPPVRASTAGLLDTTLEARVGATTFGGRPAVMASFDGGVPGPTLRVRPGDRVRIRLVNRLDEPTNLHFHGLHLPPTGTADNTFVNVMPGESFQYDFVLPPHHPAGTFWYHPHLHGRVAAQVFQGLVGAIVVEGDLDRVPEIAAARERLLVLKDGTIDASGRVSPAGMMDAMNGREGQLVTVNGKLKPRLTLRPGEVERWRIVNAGSARYYRLRLGGHAMHWIASDGGPLPAPMMVDELLLPPGKRAEVLVQAGTPGAYQLSSLPYSRGGMMMGGMMGRSSLSTTEIALAELMVLGEPATMALPVRLAGYSDVQVGEVAARRELVLSESMGPGGMRFMIDGKVFAHDRVDIRVRLGTTEEWTIRNATDMDHPFHLHTNPFRVVAANGRPIQSPAWEDVVNVPAGHSVTFRVPFRDFPGKTMYHCHILDHEDLGMMGVVEIT